MRRFMAERMAALAIAFLLSMPSALAAQGGGERSMVEGPRFLMASAASPASKGKGSVLVPVSVDQIPVLARKLSLDLDGVPLKEALATIAVRANLDLVYGDQVLPPGRRVRLRASAITLAGALTDVLLGTGIDVVFNQEMVASLVKRPGYVVRARPLAEVRGRVTNQKTGGPVAGANVTLALPDTTLRAVTGDSGAFVLSGVPEGEHAVTVRYIGFHPLTKRVKVDTTVVHVNFAVESRAVALDELVTTATGAKRRRDLGNAITTIRADSVLAVAPIRNLTDLLEGRVTGMTLQHTTGAPGDPSRIRLRGLGSVTRSNDPVVIVDGVRIDAAQSEERSGNLAKFSASGVSPAPSPLDQIDPNIIEKVEVFKGPSAATLYGADAANGVIVITTKRGRAGPTRWTAHLSRGHSKTLGRYPDGYYRWGHNIYTNVPEVCPMLDLNCVQDSLVRFQALNDPELTILDQGTNTNFSLSASGGTQSLTYSFTGSYMDQVGLLRLPAFEAERFRVRFNREPDDWMLRPHQYTWWSVTSNVTARLSRTADVTLLAKVSKSEQQRSTLESEVNRLIGTYVDEGTGLYHTPIFSAGTDFLLSPGTSTFLDSYFTRITASMVTLTTGIQASWRPRSWLSASANAGIDVIPRDDHRLRPLGLSSPTDSGEAARGSGRAVSSSFNLQGTARKPLGRGFVFETNVGANLTTRRTDDLLASGVLRFGTSRIGSFLLGEDNRASTSVFGWYLEPRITGQRLALSTGIRLDGGSAYGTRVSGGLGRGLLSLPKLNGSWVISEEPFFPLKSLFSSLRLRGAYGQAQRQPGPADRLRLFGYTQQGDQSIGLSTLGNTKLRPERTKEFEGGFDADILDGRVALQFTAWRKATVDALLGLTLPPSVGVGSGGADARTVLTNIGNIRNMGVDFTLGITPIRSPGLTWSAELSYSRITNVLTKLGQGVMPNKLLGIVEGYPLYGRWDEPIVGFADLNADGVIGFGEYQVGDSLEFLGKLDPDYITNLHTNVTLFGGAVGVTASFSYQSGASQFNSAGAQWVLARSLVDPSASLGEQAAMVASMGNIFASRTNYGLVQEVSTFRFNTLSVNYRAPARVARLLRMRELTVAVQGRNLGLHSTYAGKDPDVNAWGPGERIVDTGQLAQPREWQVAFNLSY